MDYPTALAWLYATQFTGIKLGLETVGRLLRELEFGADGGARIVHVAGTNGKGSVCAMLDAVCRRTSSASANGCASTAIPFPKRPSPRA